MNPAAGVVVSPDEATRLVAGVVASSKADALPEVVVRHVVRTFVNFVGCAFGGYSNEAVRLVARALASREEYEEGPASGPSMLAAAPHAAMLTAMSAAVNAFDDTHAQAVIHPGSAVGAAVTALASRLQEPVGGDRFLNALAWGLEIACRLSKAISVAPAAASVGWSQTGIAAPVGASAACAKLLGLGERATGWAIGIAATLASGLRVANGSMAMHLIPGRAAATGVEAALLAKAGLSGPDDALEGRHGYLELFAREAAMEHLVGGLGTRFELLSNAFKAYPCGIVIHAVIDACLALRSSSLLAPPDIREVVLEVAPVTIALADDPHPSDMYSAQVSVQHWAAAALWMGKAGLEQISAKVLFNPDIGRLREKCRLVSAPALNADAAIVTVRMLDGHEQTARVDHCVGSIENPLTDEALSRKFLGQTAPVLGEADAAALLQRCWSLAGADDVRTISARLP